MLDTKLARHPRPEHALQLCFYSQAVAEIQELTPELAYVMLGTSERVAIRLANVSAYFRRVRRRLEAAVDGRPTTAAYPCDHCLLCNFHAVCEEGWERDDHLTRVAGIRRDQIERLLGAGISSLAALARRTAHASDPEDSRRDASRGCTSRPPSSSAVGAPARSSGTRDPPKPGADLRRCPRARPATSSWTSRATLSSSRRGASSFCSAS